ERRNLQVRVVPSREEDGECLAWVTFTGSSSVRVSVRQPKLELKVTGPEAPVMVGDTATFTPAVTNPGSMPATKVKVHAALTPGLECAPGPAVEFDVGTLAAGETRNVQVVCAAKLPGEQTCDATAVSGDLQASGRAGVAVMLAHLELEATGPALRYL